MSENKCPFCGEAMITTEDKIVLCENSDCATMFNEWDYPKVAAAMELAKATAKRKEKYDKARVAWKISDSANDAAERELFITDHEVNDATWRVLEVFK